MPNRVVDPSGLKTFPAALIAILFLASCGNRVDPAPKPQPPPPFEFLGAWDNKGEGPGKLDAPVAFAADPLGNIYFADPGSGFVHKFESNGKPLLSFEDSRVRHATAIAVDSGGAIYLADPQHGSLVIFFPDGSFLRNLRSAPQRKPFGPFGISTDDQGNLYLPDAERSRVLKFDAHGRLLKSWSAPQEPESADERPSWISVSPDGSVFVAYFKTGRIEKYSTDGSRQASWPALDRTAGESDSVSGLTAGGEFVFALISPSMKIRVWKTDGQKSLDADLSEHLGAIAAPQILVTSHSELLVFDPAAPRVFRFRMHLENKGQK